MRTQHCSSVLDLIATEHANELRDHRAARSIQVARELELRPSLDRLNYVPTLDFDLGNDSITAGTGDDLVIGDDGVIATPLILVTPSNELEARDLDVHVELLLDQLVNRDRARTTSSYTNSPARTSLIQSGNDGLLQPLVKEPFQLTGSSAKTLSKAKQAMTWSLVTVVHLYRLVTSITTTTTCRYADLHTVSASKMMRNA